MRRHPCGLLFLVAIALLALLAPPAGSTPGSPSPSALPEAAERLVRAGLKDLHDGLYARAEDSFRAAGRAAPADPAPDLFVAFASWWRMIQNRSDRSLDDAFLRATTRVFDSGGTALEARSDDVRLLTIVGTAHILRSQVEGLRRNIFKAAQEARRGKALLESALEIDPAQKDALFGLGAYNYYAERIPGLARGLLFMPRGDADKGLGQLRTVAASGSYFRTDARLLLALVCGSREEQCYDDALAHLNVALSENPTSPLLLGSIGGVRMRLGNYPEAIRAFEAALAAAQGGDPERVRQRRSLDLYLAEALAADWRLARSRAVLKEAGDPATLPDRDRQLLERVTEEIAQKGDERAGAPASHPADPQRPAVAAARTSTAPLLQDPLSGALAALERGQDAEAVALLARAAAARPDDPVPRFLTGRIHFDHGRLDEADREFDAALARAPRPPAWMAGWIELYRGFAERSRGRREEAQTHFRAASEVRRFRSAERGLLEIQEGTPGRGRCRP